MNGLIETLYAVSTALLVPVMAALLLLLAWSLVGLGGFVREALERRREEKERTLLFPWLSGKGGPPGDVELDRFFASRGAGRGFLSLFSVRGAALRRRPRELRKLLDELEIDIGTRLSRLVLGARVGPMLGLMGTLIPLGPALIGLSTGEIEVLARNLVVAFSTTVVGLLTGGLCHAMLQVRRNWYARDVSHLEYLCEVLGGEAPER